MMMKLLLGRGANPYAQDGEYNTNALVAALENHRKVEVLTLVGRL